MENQKKKLRLNELTVESFVTSSKAAGAKGGTSWWTLATTPLLTPLTGCDDHTVDVPTDDTSIYRNDNPHDTILGSVDVYATLEPENTNCNCPSYHSGCYRP